MPATVVWTDVDGVLSASLAPARVDEALRQSNSEDVIAQYVARLKDEVGVSINQGLLAQASGNSQQQY